MITEDALEDAIRSCMDDPNPTANTCLKLSSYLFLRDRLFADTLSEASGGPQSEFSTLAYRLSKDDLVRALDGLMEALMAIQPKLYDQTMAKLRNIGGRKGTRF